MKAKLLVFPTRLSSLDIEALRDRARVRERQSNCDRKEGDPVLFDPDDQN